MGFLDSLKGFGRASLDVLTGAVQQIGPPLLEAFATAGAQSLIGGIQSRGGGGQQIRFVGPVAQPQVFQGFPGQVQDPRFRPLSPLPPPQIRAVPQPSPRPQFQGQAGDFLPATFTPRINTALPGGAPVMPPFTSQRQGFISPAQFFPQARQVAQQPGIALPGPFRLQAPFASDVGEIGVAIGMFRPTMAGVRASRFVVAHPMTGAPVEFQPRGRCILSTSDLAGAKRVRRVAGLARRTRGRR